MAVEISEGLPTFLAVTPIIFIVLVLVMIGKAVKNNKNKGKILGISALILFGWFALVYFLSQADFFFEAPLFAPNIFLGFIFLFIVLRFVYKSKFVRNIFNNVSQPWIIGIQIYRIVGIVFLNYYALGILPALFAFPAGFGDMLVGLSAPFVAFFYFKRKSFSRNLGILWNYVGILDLVVAISTGILAFSIPFGFVKTNVPTDPLSLFPLALVPLFAVPLAFLLHMFSLRVLKKAR